MRSKYQDTNKALISGEIVEEPKLNHKGHGEVFYMISIKIVRKSGDADIIPVMVSDHTIDISELTLGRKIKVDGRIYGNNNEDKILIVYVFADDITLDYNLAKNDANYITLKGFIVRDVSVNTSKESNRMIANILLACNRRHNKADYIPLVAWGRNAKFSKRLKKGDRVQCLGRIQSRQFRPRSGSDVDEGRMVYEVSLSEIEYAVDEEVVENDSAKGTDN